MFTMRTKYLISCLSVCSTMIHAQNHEISSSMLFLKKLSYVMWHSFFFVPKIFGALFMGNMLYIAQALILLSCMITIESYCLYKYLHTPCQIIARRMILINGINIIMQWLAAYPLFYLIDLHNRLQDPYSKAYALYLLIIIASCIILLCRTMIAYVLYQRLDKSVDRSILKKAMLKTNIISYGFIVTIFFISICTPYKLI